jgi:hypothetical protein
MMKVRSYALLGNTVLRRIERQLDAVVSTWRAEWGLDALDIEVTCQRSWEAQAQRGEGWQRRYFHEDRRAWLSWPPEFLKYLQRQIFPADHRHAFQSGDKAPIATDGALQAVHALADAIARDLTLSRMPLDSAYDGKPDQELFDYASGAVLIVLKFGEQSIKCLLNHAVMRALHGQGGTIVQERLKPVDVTKALSSTPMSLKVCAGQVEVGVGNFMALALGDVICLPTSIDQPLTVFGPENRLLFGAHLGKQNQSMAIEVVSYKK